MGAWRCGFEDGGVEMGVEGCGDEGVEIGCRNVWRWDCGDGDLEMGSGRMWEWERRIGEGKLRWRVEIMG